VCTTLALFFIYKRCVNLPQLGITFFGRSVIHSSEFFNLFNYCTVFFIFNYTVFFIFNYTVIGYPIFRISLNARDEMSFPLYRETRGWIPIEQSLSNRNGITATFRNDHQSCLSIEIALLECLNSTNVCLASHQREK